jgi:hypothetical protein
MEITANFSALSPQIITDPAKATWLMSTVSPTERPTKPAFCHFFGSPVMICQYETQSIPSGPVNLTRKPPWHNSRGREGTNSQTSFFK